MKFLLIILFSSPFLSILAFDITPVDETEEGIIEAKKNRISPDGKVIYNPMESLIVPPMEVTILQSYKPTIKTQKRNVIYPIGTIHPKVTEPIIDNPESIKKEEDLFLSKDEADKDSSPNEIKFKVDTNFKKHSDSEVETDKPNNIPPVNIE